MPSDSKKLSDHVASGIKTGTGTAISIICGFKPKAVWLFNATGVASLNWNDLMADGKGYKTPGGSAGFTGTAAAQTFTGASSKLNLATPAFSGTGFATAGQVITTTDNQTMAATTTAAGMWFIANALTTTAPVLVVSNTIVAGAPAVLTVIGTAPATDAGTYKIVSTIPVGTNGTSAITGTATIDSSFISTGGITPFFNGFSIGTDTDINVNAEDIYWVAIK